MNCKNCGILLADDDKFCKNCGTPVQNDAMAAEGMQQPTMDMNAGDGMGYNQYQNYGQPMGMGQNYNGMNYVQPPKQSGGGKAIAIIIIVVILLGGLVAGGVVALNYMKNDGKIAKSKTEKVDKDDDKDDADDADDADDKEDVEKTGQQTTYKVTFENFVFDIPSDYIYEDDITSLNIADADNTWTASLEINSGSFPQIKARKAEIKTLLEQQGLTSSDAVEKTVGGMEYIVLEASYSGDNVIVALAPADVTHYFFLTVLGENNDFDYGLLEKITPILSTATPAADNTGLNVKSKKKIDATKIEDNFKKDEKKKK